MTDEGQFWACITLNGLGEWHVGLCEWRDHGFLRVNLLDQRGHAMPRRTFGPSAIWSVVECTEEVAVLTAMHGPVLAATPLPAWAATVIPAPPVASTTSRG